LPRVLSKLDDLEARTQLSWASTVACSAFAKLGGSDGAMTMHGIEHPLSGQYDMAHGDGLAALLPSWLGSLAEIRADRISKLGTRVFQENNGIVAIEKWLKECKMNYRLKNLGVDKRDLLSLGQKAISTAPWLVAHPKTLDAKAVEEIYRKAW
jgi:alcohol dehydrogenase YqhD (iron-dependent ADH family)